MRTTTLLLPLAFLCLGAATVQAQDNAPTATQTEPARGVVTGDQTIEAGQVVDEIVVVGGDLRVLGEVSGDAVVIGGDLILEEGGLVEGDAVVTGGELINDGGRVRGEMRTIDGAGLNIAREIQRALGDADAPRARPEVNVRPDARAEAHRDSSHRWFDPIRRGFAGIFSTLALALVLAGVGSLLVFYGRPYLETVSDTIRGSTVRAGATGLAACFLVIPAFVVLIVAFAVSIVGIPFLLVAVPLYPLAIFAACIFGLLATAHALGERTAEQSRDGLDFRHRNSYAYLFTGLGMLLTPLLAAHLIEMTGFLGFIGAMIGAVTWFAIWVATTIGFGAVILSRGGTRRTFAGTPPEPIIDADDFFGEEPLANGDDL